MKVPQIFLVGRDLDQKIEEALKNTKEIPKLKEIVEDKKGKREIVIDLGIPEIKEGNKIYVAFAPRKVGEYYFLDISSNEPFYFPVSENPIDWASRRRHTGVAALKSDDSLMNYLRLLREENEAFFVWQDKQDAIVELKGKFYEDLSA